MKIIVTKYHKFSEGKIKGICNITIDIDGFPFTINGVKVIENKTGGHFYGLPSREYLSSEGEKKYAQHCGFFTKDGYKEFHTAINEAFTKFFKQEYSAPMPEPAPSVSYDEVPF